MKNRVVMTESQLQASILDLCRHHRLLAPPGAAVRFASKISFDQDACWMWTACTNNNGYGRFSVGCNRLVYPHRLMYEVMVGPIPEDLEIDHTCRERRCVRPDHLETVTHLENLRRKSEHITHCVNGHALQGDNVYRWAKAPNRRLCRTCRIARAAARRRRLAGA